MQKCMATWKEVLPDYEWVLWDQKRFNINSVDFVKEAVSVKKWAFAADYIRLYALYTEGGIYLDMDVIVKKSFDCFLEYDFFTAVESYKTWFSDAQNKVYVCEDGSIVPRIEGTALQAAIMGGKAGNNFLKNCMDWYGDKHFILPDGSFFDQILAPDIYATIAQKYGFRYKNEEQSLTDNIKIYPSPIIASDIWTFSKDSVAIHCCAGTWQKNWNGNWDKDSLFYNLIVCRVMLLHR
jgi:hypothetical protein